MNTVPGRLCAGKQMSLWGWQGVSSPGAEIFEQYALRKLPEKSQWLELGYHIFEPYRKLGYAREAVTAIAEYAHEVLSAELLAVIHEKTRPPAQWRNAWV